MTFDLSKLPKPSIHTNVTKVEFEHELKPMGMPFVIQDFASNWEPVKAANNQQNMHSYLKSCASVLSKPMSLSRIPTTENSRMFYNQDMTAMNFGVAELPLEKGLERMLTDTQEADYAAQCVPIEQYFDKLLPQIDNPLVENTLTPFIWFGNKVVVAPHFDESDNIAVVVAGKRRFTLFPPQQTENLYIGPLEFTPAGQPISLVNILEPDLTQHPKYASAYEHALSIELAPGDAIYIPTPWWHHVQSLSSFNILVNYWWNDSDLGTAKPLAAILHAMQAFRHLPKAQQKAFASMLQYYAFDDPKKSHEHIPKHAKGWLDEANDKTRLELEHFIRVFSK